MRHSKQQQGFTLIEVMVAIGIVTVGSLGLIAMQTTAMRANREARVLMNAVAINQLWIERLEKDAQSWRAAGSVALTQTEFLTNIVGQTSTTDWFLPDIGDGVRSYAFNWDGDDTFTDSEFRFCTHIRLNWIRENNSIRADARTMWMREGRFSGSSNKAGDYLIDSDCARSDTNSLDIEDIPNMGAVSGSTVLRWYDP